jgi:hypothetical protein
MADSNGRIEQSVTTKKAELFQDATHFAILNALAVIMTSNLGGKET